MATRHKLHIFPEWIFRPVCHIWPPQKRGPIFWLMAHMVYYNIQHRQRLYRLRGFPNALSVDGLPEGASSGTIRELSDSAVVVDGPSQRKKSPSSAEDPQQCGGAHIISNQGDQTQRFQLQLVHEVPLAVIGQCPVLLSLCFHS